MRRSPPEDRIRFQASSRGRRRRFPPGRMSIHPFRSSRQRGPPWCRLQRIQTLSIRWNPTGIDLPACSRWSSTRPRRVGRAPFPVSFLPGNRRPRIRPRRPRTRPRRPSRFAPSWIHGRPPTRPAACRSPSRSRLRVPRIQPIRIGSRNPPRIGSPPNARRGNALPPWPGPRGSTRRCRSPEAVR